MSVPADVGFLLCVLSASSPQNSRGGWLTHIIKAPCERIRTKYPYGFVPLQMPSFLAGEAPLLWRKPAGSLVRPSMLVCAISVKRLACLLGRRNLPGAFGGLGADANE